MYLYAQKMWFNTLECILPGRQGARKKQGKESPVKKQNDAKFLLNLIFLQCIILMFTTYLYIE